MVQVVTVASKQPIAVHTKLTEQQLVLKAVPKSVLTGTEFTQIKDVAGQITQVELSPGELILKSRVVLEGQGALPYRIPAGTRAMTIRIDELNGVAGHPEPGDLVDLVLVLPAKTPERPAATARLLYESVLVLAKGPADDVAAGTEGIKLSSLTLALKPDAAVEVGLAEQIGHIKVLLRPAVKESAAGAIIKTEAGYR